MHLKSIKKAGDSGLEVGSIHAYIMSSRCHKEKLDYMELLCPLQRASLAGLLRLQTAGIGKRDRPAAPVELLALERQEDGPNPTCRQACIDRELNES